MISWRQQAAAVIERVIREVGRDDLKALRKAISDAYPFGPRQNHPYKIWLSEVSRQLGPRQAETMSLAEALQIEGKIWRAELLGLIEMSEQDCYRLGLVGARLQRAKDAGLLNPETVMISDADAKFLRRLKRKIKQGERDAEQ